MSCGLRGILPCAECRRAGAGVPTPSLNAFFARRLCVWTPHARRGRRRHGRTVGTGAKLRPWSVTGPVCWPGTRSSRSPEPPSWSSLAPDICSTDSSAGAGRRGRVRPGRAGHAPSRRGKPLRRERGSAARSRPLRRPPECIGWSSCASRPLPFARLAASRALRCRTRETATRRFHRAAGRRVARRGRGALAAGVRRLLLLLRPMGALVAHGRGCRPIVATVPVPGQSQGGLGGLASEARGCRCAAWRWRPLAPPCCAIFIRISPSGEVEK